MREIGERLTSARFLRAYSIRPGELRIESGEGEIVASFQPAHTTLYIAGGNSHEPKKNVMSFFKELEGLEMTSISIPNDDKIVKMNFGEYDLTLRFYNSPNALLYKNDELISSFKKEKTVIPKAKAEEKGNAIRAQLPMLGKWLEAELEYELKQKEQFDIIIECRKFDEKLRKSKEAYVYFRKNGLLLSPIHLALLTDKYERYESPSKAIEFVVHNRTRQASFKSKRDSLLVKLRNALARTEKALSDAKNGIDNSEREDKYTSMGDAVQAHAHEIEKGREYITIENVGKLMKIPLDPSLTPFENAKRYYDKARRARDNRKQLLIKFETLTKEKNKLSQFYDQAENLTESKQIESLEKEISKSGFSLHQTFDDLAESDPLSKFRQFIVAGGFRVLVGKNAKHNDELTMKVAKKEDIWFHARHVPGSHVVLQTNNAKQIPKEAIEQAAEIAAYFSDARTQKHAPVAYTRRKFVRKPRGAALGAVMLEREEVIIVTPRIPEN